MVKLNEKNEMKYPIIKGYNKYDFVQLESDGDDSD